MATKTTNKARPKTKHDPTMRSVSCSPSDPAQMRRERLEYFAQQIYLTGLQVGTPRDATDCASEAKALYAELDRVES